MPTATVKALYAFSQRLPERLSSETLQFEVDGIVGDRHRGQLRPTFRNDKQPQGMMRRNERMWSAIAEEELAQIAADMGLAQPLTPADTTSNILFSGYAELSKLPKGSLLKFPSGLELIVEEFCAPCLDKGAELAGKYRRADGSALEATAFSKASKLSRGVVGVVEVAGAASVGDVVEIVPYAHPAWLS